MAGVSFRLDDNEVLGALDRLHRAADNPRPAMDELGAHFVFSTQRNIELETAPSGQRWPALSPRTAAKRVGTGRRGFDHMLRVKLRLFQSISYEALDASVEWGSNLVYARIHQLGGEIPMQPRRGTIRFKSIRRKGGGVRSRFVRLGTKGATEKAVSIRGHTVRVPARAYLGISAYDREQVPEIVSGYLRREVGQ